MLHSSWTSECTKLGDDIEPHMPSISVKLLHFFQHPSAEAVAHRPILPVSYRKIVASEAVCPMCRGSRTSAAFASTVAFGLVPEGVKPTVRLGISL